jgi:ABC-type transport system involved in cytochrome c biogenesis permease subunit
MDRLTVLCFAGTYGLALICELARFVVRSAARWYLTVGLTALAWLVQTAYLVNLARTSGSIPISTPFESVLVLSWIFAAVGLYLMVRAPKPVAVGTFVLPLVLALTSMAGTSSLPRHADWGIFQGGATAFWGSVHGVFLLAGAVSTCVAFAAGMMYLAQANRLKHKRPPRFGFALPSLERSERLNRGAITLAFPLLTFGLMIGLVLIVAGRGEGAPGWTDPKVVSALAMWLAFAVLLHARYRPAMRGKGVMLLTIVAFGFLVFTWVGVEVLHLPTVHGTVASSRRTL